MGELELIPRHGEWKYNKDPVKNLLYKNMKQISVIISVESMPKVSRIWSCFFKKKHFSEMSKLMMHRLEDLTNKVNK